MMQTITVADHDLQLLPEKAIYIRQLSSLLVSDVHLGKSETFQALGVPIPNAINQATLNRLQHLCETFKPKKLFILGDLFHSKFALVEEVLQPWNQFLAATQTKVQLIVGNHDRKLVPTLESLSIQCHLEAVQLNQLILSHEPVHQPHHFNICGHIHPCIRIKTRLEHLRLPCFYLDNRQTLILPAFGEFTGGYDMPPKPNSTAFLIAEGTVIPWELT